MNVQSDGSFLLKVGGLILESGKYFAFAGESRHELYRDMTLEQKGQLRSNEYAFDVFIHNDDSNDVNARSKSLYGEFKIMVDPEKKTVIFEQNYESVDFVPVIENIPVGSNGGLWDYGRIENGFPTIHIPTESNHLRNVFRYKNFNLRYLRNRESKNAQSHFYYLQGANFGQEIFHENFVAESFSRSDTVNETNFDGYYTCQKCQCRDCNCLNGQTFPEAGFRFELLNISYILYFIYSASN